MKTTRDIVECIMTMMYHAACEFRLKSMANSIYGISAIEEQCKRVLQQQCALERQYKDRIALLCIAIEKVERGEY